jgi:hypothetical protein
LHPENSPAYQKVHRHKFPTRYIGRTFIGLHELAHYFLHSPTSPKQWFYCRRIAERTRSKHDCEADAFALIAMLPYWMMMELNSDQDLHPALVDLCIRRKKLWEKHGI